MTSIVAVEVGVAAGELGERVAFELEPQVEAVGALQVVEAVAVLQAFELLLEHEVEGRAEQAAEDRLALGEAADPEVDVVEAAGRRRREHERRRWPRTSARGRGALGRERRRAR